MRVKISYVVNIRAKAYAREYGLPEFDRRAIREDVKFMAESLAVEHLAELGLIEKPDLDPVDEWHPPERIGHE